MRKQQSRVSFNIRIIATVLCSLLGGSSAIVFAQNTTNLEVEKPVQSLPENAIPTLSTVNTNSLNTNSQQAVLHLEDTIRGNKEQPQVLTIVPWQLPVHQRINENTQWQLQVKPLSSIERNAFLRNLAAVKEIKTIQETNKPLISNK